MASSAGTTFLEYVELTAFVRPQTKPGLTHPISISVPYDHVHMFCLDQTHDHDQPAFLSALNFSEA